ncbi:sulfatase-like hydrolase/transferase [archaeon]|nr:sulfatase-like hydrolase/transferase [archaeon]
MDYMPLTKAAIFDNGIAFSKGYVTTPLCCPSRASIFTGMCAHNTGVLENKDELSKKTFIDYLHENGYYTGLIGKYLNSWDSSARPEFDFWVAMPSILSKKNGNSINYTYYEPTLNINGKWQEHSGYLTYILRDYALQFLESAPEKKPFVLVFTPAAPHPPADPAPEHKELYSGLASHRPQSFNEQDISDKPAWLKSRKELGAKGIAQIDNFRLKQIRSLASLDLSISEILEKLEEQGKLENTFVLYISDNGYFWGEHRLSGKSFVYEEAIKVPFAIRYAPFTSNHRIDNNLVANIDIAPTIYELAGIQIPSDVDGLSLLPLLKAGENLRDALLIEGIGYNKAHTISKYEDDEEGENTLRIDYSAVVTDMYIYIENKNDISELYNLEKDPYELQNEINNPEYADTIAELKQVLKELKES